MDGTRRRLGGVDELDWTVHLCHTMNLLDALPEHEAAAAGDIVLAGQLDWLTVSWSHGLLPAALQFYTVHQDDILRLWRTTSGNWSDIDQRTSGSDAPPVRNRKTVASHTQR